MKMQRKNQLHARDQEYAEILRRRQEYEAELNEKAPSEGLGAAKGKGQYWQKRLGQAKRRSKPKKEVNTKACRSCKAKAGEPCSFVGRTGLVVLTETHATQARKRRAEKQGRLSGEELAERRRSRHSTPELGRLYAGRTTSRKDARNGGAPMQPPAVTPPDFRPMALDETYDR